MRRISIVLGSVLFSCSGLLWAQQGSSATQPAPILAGRAEHGLPGKVQGTERWIVQFATRSFDLQAFRTAIYTRRPAAEVAAIVAGLEQSVIADQAPFVAAVTKLGGTVVHQWWLVNAAAVEIDPAQLLALRQLPNIARVQPDEACEPVIATATNANNHRADELQAQGHIGTGVTIGVIDTGQDENMAGTGRPHRVYFPGGDPLNTSGGGIGGSRLLVNRQIGLASADDTHGHGTGVASICGGAGWSAAGADAGHAPGSWLTGYSIADSSSGGSSLATEALGWQSMAADRATYNVVTANMSYSATSDPLDVSQQAIDSAALNADVLCCVAAGNSGPSTAGSCGATNSLAVAAVAPNTHAVAGFSSRGPLNGDPQRTYPDIAACGVNTVMANFDSEGSSYTASGTSMASPQVAGAGAQLRARFPALTALETKAVLLGSTYDLAAQNPGLSRNDYGMGLLRNDRAHELVLGGAYGNGSLTSVAPTLNFSMPVVGGMGYQVAIAWFRQDVMSTAWSDLDLAVLDGLGAVIGQSTSPRNLYEMVRFTAPTTGTVTLRVQGTAIAAGVTQPFAWAFGEQAPIPVAGSATTFGAGCAPECTFINEQGGTLAPLLQASEFAYDMVAPTAMQILGVDVYTQAIVPAGVVMGIYTMVGGAISQTHTGIAAVNVGSAPGFYHATFAVPVSVPAGPFWISIDHRQQQVYLSNLTSGATSGGYQRSTLLSGAWTRSPLTLRPAFRVFCSQNGLSAPSLTATGQFKIGGSVNFNLTGAPAGTAAFFSLGLSNAAAPFGSLPFALEGLGAPGCSLLTSGEAVSLLFADPAGAATSTLAIPNAVPLTSLVLFGQYEVLAPGANNLGLLVSRGVRVLIGN